MCDRLVFLFFFFNDTATTEIYTLSLHDALPISPKHCPRPAGLWWSAASPGSRPATPRWPRTRSSGRRSEEHTSELQSLAYLVCRLLLEKKKNNTHRLHDHDTLYVTCRQQQVTTS